MIIADENCPITVERELLTLDINEFPEYYGEDEPYAYNAKVTAHYELYNPADYAVEVSLAFPFGRIPDYANNFADSFANYKITADGEELQSSLRHTLASDDFNTKDDLEKLADGFKQDEFYYPEMPVVKYVFRIYDLVTSSKWNDAYMEAEIPHSESYAVFSERMGNFDLSHFIRNDEEIIIYVAGEGFDSSSIEWHFYTDMKKNRKTEAKVSLEETEQITLKDLALTYYDKDGSVSESDWYNAVTDSVGEYKSLRLSSLDVSYWLMGWYLYSLSVPAHGRIVNEVTAPLYPDINEHYVPEIFSYEYLLSPAKGWASFGSLEVVINTPFYLLESSYGFEKTEGGYKLTLDGLPDGELTFSLSKSENPKAEFNAWTIVACIILGLFILFAVGMLGTLIVFIVLGTTYIKKKRKQKKE